MLRSIVAVIFLFAFSAKAGLPPTTLKGQSGSKATTFNFEVPNKQATKTSTGGLIETGNKNLLDDPSFEAATRSTAWVISNGTAAAESTVVIDGVKSLKVTAAAQTPSIVQDSTLYQAQFASTVQGLVSVRVKTSLSGVKVCSRIAGATSTTSCVDVSSSNTWGLYKVPFILGATSNGISIAASSSVTGDIYIDEAYLGASNIVEMSPVDSTWTAYTPAWSTSGSAPSIGNGTLTGFWQRNGETINLSIIFIAGSTTTFGTGDWYFSLPGTLSADGNKIISGGMKGWAYLTDDNVTTARKFAKVTSHSDRTKLRVIPTDTNSDVTSAVPWTWAQNDVIQLSIESMPISGWPTNSAVYASQCSTDVECENTFTAKIASTGTVSAEPVNFLDGNCSNANPRVCNFNTPLPAFTATPNCTCTVDVSGSSSNVNNDCHIEASSSSSISLKTVNNGSALQMAVILSCTKSSTDYKAKRNIVGTFEETPKIKGVTSPRTIKYSFGGAGSLTAPTTCAASPCTEYNDPAAVIAAPTRASAGVYQMIIAAGTFSNSTQVDCDCKAFAASGNPIDCRAYNNGNQTLTSSSSGGYTVGISAGTPAGVAADSYINVSCEGSAP